MTAVPLTGRCNCGAVRFELHGPVRDVVICHCSLCRRSGTNAAAYTSLPRTALHVVSGEQLAVYVDPNGRERSFCRSCGSALFWSPAGAAEVSVSAGALDGETGLRIAAHIFAGSAAGWETIPPGVTVLREGLASLGAGRDE